MLQCDRLVAMLQLQLLLVSVFKAGQKFTKWWDKPGLKKPVRSRSIIKNDRKIVCFFGALFRIDTFTSCKNCSIRSLLWHPKDKGPGRNVAGNESGWFQVRLYFFSAVFLILVCSSSILICYKAHYREKKSTVFPWKWAQPYLKRMGLWIFSYILITRRKSLSVRFQCFAK